MDSFDLSEQRIVQLEQIPPEIRRQVETGDGVEYALDLSLNRLRGIDQIGVFEHVSQLDLSGNQLDNVNGIQALRRLQSLDLSRNCIATVDLLALLPALQVLKVAENSLTSIDALQLLPELRVVDASYNRIAKWPPLAGLSLLETLDLSDNMLGAFSSSVSTTLFPSRLRRLSIARNQIDKLCGVVCLGLQLPMLEFFAFDGNPVVLEVSRSGGQLERLVATFFPSLPLSNDGGLTMTLRRHEEFATPPYMVNALKRAILEGREEALSEFLVTGSIAEVDLVGVGGTVMPPPPPVERPLIARQQLPITNTSGDQSAVDALSHDSKMEIWKCIQEDRKAQFSQSNASAFASSTVKRDKSVRWEQHIEQSLPVPPLQDDVRKPALTTADLAVPEPSPQAMPALDASSLSVMKPLEPAAFPSSIDPMKDSQAQNSPDSDALVKKVKALTEQVLTMRKYMKVWVKREKMVRDASARKIQRWLRQLQRLWQLRQRVLRSRKRRQQEYGLRACSSTLMQNPNYRGGVEARREATSTQIIQSRARGFITRQRLKSFKRLHLAATRIQRAWREVLRDRRSVIHGDCKPPRRGHSPNTFRWHEVLRGVVRCSRDVKQLQQVCAVQDAAISSLWSSSHSGGIEKKTIRLEELGHGASNNEHHSGEGYDPSPEVYTATEVNGMKKQLQQQSHEIDSLKQQLQALQNLVASLAATKFENVNQHR